MKSIRRWVRMQIDKEEMHRIRVTRFCVSMKDAGASESYWLRRPYTHTQLKSHLIHEQSLV